MPEFKFSANSIKHRSDVDPRLIEIGDMAIKLTTVDFGYPKTGGRRSGPEQRSLYEMGKSNCDGILKVSKHQSGHALDFYAYVDGKVSYKMEHLAVVAAAHLQAAAKLGYKLRWGGLWSRFTDAPHIELDLT